MADGATVTVAAPRSTGRIPMIGAPKERPPGAPAYVPPTPVEQPVLPSADPAVTPFGAARPLPPEAAVLVTRLRAGITLSGLRLAHLLRAPLRLDWVGVSRVPATAAADAVVLPLAAATFGGAVVLDAACARALGDVSLGGDGRSTEPPAAVALTVAARHLGAAFAPVSELVGAPHGALPFDAVHPRGLPTSLRGADVIAALATLVLDEQLIGAVTLLIAARPLLGGEASHPGPQRPELAAVPVTVAVQLPPRSISALDASRLEAGDVIPMNLTATRVIGLLDGTTVITGSLGQTRGHRAVLVESLALEAS